MKGSIGLAVFALFGAIAYGVAEDYDDQTLPGFESSTWPNGMIPYEIDGKFEPYEKKRIQDSIAIINQQAQIACVQFVPRTDDDRDFVSFVRHEQKCQSQFIGYAEVGAQDLYLAPNCSTPRYIYWVLLQVLGLPAEHMRPDRDDYIQVNWENIDPIYWSAFKKYNFIDQRLMDLPYEYGSRLHYTDERFAIARGQKTLEPVGDGFGQVLGNPLAPTYGDYKKVGALYCDNPTFVTDQPPVTIPRLSSNRPAPRPGAVGGVFAGLMAQAPASNAVPQKPQFNEQCQCLARPNDQGSCDGIGAFQWAGMWEQCRNSSLTSPVCQCENTEQNPCWCEAAVGMDCRGDQSRCPLTRCVKKCLDD